MTAISSNTLFHMTRKYANFKRMLCTGLRFSYSFEKTTKHTAIIQTHGYLPELTEKMISDYPDNPMTGVAIPMVCFCDIPLLRIGEHCSKYGKFAIGLDKEIISEYYNNLINPIWYLDSQNAFDFLDHYPKANLFIQKQFHLDLLDLKEINTELIECKKYALMKQGEHMSNTKIMSNYLLGFTKQRSSFYDEREWRALLPDDEDIAPWFWDVSKEYFDTNRKEWNDSMDSNEYGYIKLFPDIFNDAITHIIVDTNNRIPAIIDFIMKSKQIFGVNDIAYEQRLLLISKITSFERINQDF